MDPPPSNNKGLGLRVLGPFEGEKGKSQAWVRGYIMGCTGLDIYIYMCMYICLDMDLIGA